MPGADRPSASLPFTLRELTAWWTGRRRTFDVRGGSMCPGLVPGDRVLVRPCPLEALSPGVVVVLEDPQRPGAWLVKRLATKTASTFTVRSDDPDGARDSRQLGSLPAERLVGVVTAVADERGRLLRAPTR